ncbi:MAG: L-2-amino-thiazoline-4-carboxylic acid hydrolase [Clostridiales Family XIII bacterium]|jgi:hypothetical protein|nr:L-2-amino-thiazoline-4-carboxylic acid hydrolase [Clostridiales Family XIII bacterium]
MDKALRKGGLKTVYAALPKDIRQQVAQRYEALIRENPQTDKSLIRHVHGAILPAIAIREVLPENGYDKDECIRLIRASALDNARPMQKVFSAAGRLPFFFAFFRVMCKNAMPLMFSDGGWAFQWKTNSKTAIEWDCTQCIYHDLFVQYGVPELTPIFCECDDVIYGNIPTARWGRSKTIGRGADVCDFRFYKI